MSEAILELVLVEAFRGYLQIQLQSDDIFLGQEEIFITLDRQLLPEQLSVLEIRICALGFLHRAGHHVSFFHFVEQKPVLDLNILLEAGQLSSTQLQGGQYQLHALFGMKGLEAFQARRQVLEEIGEKLGARKREDMLPKIQELLAKVSRLDEEHARLTVELKDQ